MIIGSAPLSGGAESAYHTRATGRVGKGRSRIVQYKMSMKRGQGGERFPMQDEHEKGKNGVGVARPDASANDECREPEPGTDPGVSQVEPADRVCGVPTKGEVRLGGARAGGAELRRAGQGGARCGARLRGKSDGDERVADDAIDPRISGQRSGADGAVPAARLPGEVHCRGHRAVSGGGPGTRAVERAGHAPDSAAGVGAVRAPAVRAAGGNQRGASVQL